MGSSLLLLLLVLLLLLLVLFLLLFLLWFFRCCFCCCFTSVGGVTGLVSVVVFVGRWRYSFDSRCRFLLLFLLFASVGGVPHLVFFLFYFSLSFFLPLISLSSSFLPALR